MSHKVLTNLDMNKNELQNFAVQKLATAPSSPVESQLYYNSTDKCLYQYSGAAWVRVGVIYDMSLGVVSSNAVPLKLVGNDGTTDTVTIKGAGGTTLSVSGNTLTITTANSNTTYTFANSTGADKFTITITPSSGTATTITIPLATANIAGLMSPTQFSKLAKIEEGANKTTTDSALSNNSTNPVQNKAVKEALDLKAPLASPAFTGTPTAPKPTTDTGIANKKYVDDSIANGIAASDAMIFKGTIGTGGSVTSLPTTYKTGWTYRVITAGTYAGNVCEVGDLIIALVDRAGSGNANSDWTVAQTNIDGAITSIGGTSPISVTGNGSSKTISHANSGAAAGTYGLVSGSTLKIPKVDVNATGHVTSVTDQTVVVPFVKTYTIAAGQTSVRDTAVSATLCGYVARDAISNEQLFIDCVNDPVIPAVEFSIASAYVNDIIITASYLSEVM